MEIAHRTGQRRRTEADLADVLRFDALEVSVSSRRVWVDGRVIDMTPKEFELLAFLAQRPSETFSRAELLREVWNSSPDWQNPATVTEHIHRLRHHIEPDPARPRLLCTVRGAGYSFGPPLAMSVLDRPPRFAVDPEG